MGGSSPNHPSTFKSTGRGRAQDSMRLDNFADINMTAIQVIPYLHYLCRSDFLNVSEPVYRL